MHSLRSHGRGESPRCDGPIHKPSRRTSRRWRKGGKLAVMQDAGHVAESNRQASCQAGRHRTDTSPDQICRRAVRQDAGHTAESSRRPSRRQTESSTALSGRTPGTPLNRVDAQAVAAEPIRRRAHASPNRHVAEPNRRASCQASSQARRRAGPSSEPSGERPVALPNRTTKQAVRLAAASDAAEPNRRASCQASSLARHGTIRRASRRRGTTNDPSCKQSRKPTGGPNIEPHP
jgi:hypothetical protein